MPTTISGNTGVSQVQAGSITASDLDGAQTGDAPIFGCRAWVNFDGTKDSTGATSTANTNRLIRASGNVTSVLRNATGNYTVNFTTDLPDANYVVCGMGGAGPNNSVASPIIHAAGVYGTPTQKDASGVRLVTGATGGTVQDQNEINVAIFR